MKNPIRALLERDERRWQTQGVKDWERRRAEGKLTFVLKLGFLWGLIMIAAFTLIEYFLDGRIRVETLWSRVLMFLSLGFVLGLVFWRKGEEKYQKHLREQSEKNNRTILPPMTRL
jgi:H+/Cl- antiporter ClcA